MKETANLRKKLTSFRPKNHQDENAPGASDFLCTRFQMSTKLFGTANSHQKPIYVSPDGRKKWHQQPLSKAETNCTQSQGFFHQSWNSMIFMSNSQTLRFVGTSHSLKPGQEGHCRGILTTQMFEKKIDSGKFPYLAPFFIFQNLSLPSFLLRLFKLCLITTM